MSSLQYAIQVSVVCILGINAAFSQSIDWKKLSPLQGIRIDQIALNSRNDIFVCTWSHPDSMVMGGTVFRIERSTDHGNSWQTVFNASWQPVTLAIDSADNLYASAFEKMEKSSDNGQTWEVLADTMLAGLFVQSISISPKGHIFVAPGPFRSTDSGKHWQVLPLLYQVTNFLFLPDGSMLAGVITGYNPWSLGIYRSTNDGNSWDSVLAVCNTHIWSLAASNSHTVFAVASELDSTLGGVYRSTDGGVHWSRVNEGLPSRRVNSLAVSSTGRLFASIYGSGVFQSVDNGDTWTDFNTGLDDLRIQCLTVDRYDYLFAGTGTNDFPDSTTIRGSVHYCSTVTTVSHNISTVPTKYEFRQNYPNPFNPNTTINYGLPARSHVKLQIYDILGRVVEVLVSSEQAGGWKQVVWDANVASGMYFYRIEAVSVADPTKRFVDVKKMMLIR